MSEPVPDDELQALFARQRAAERESAPPFHAMRSRALEEQSVPRPSAPLLWRWAWPATAALSLAVATIFILGHRTSPSAAQREAAVREIEQIDAALRQSLIAKDSLTAWQSPTDFLLNPIPHEIP